MISAADALAYCMRQPGADAADCHDAVASQMVGGTYCDGDVIMASGLPKRCVSSSVLAHKLAAEVKSPMVYAGAAPSSSVVNVAAVVAICAAVGIFAFWTGRD